MSHPIVEGRVELLKVVTPGSYWISCAACVGTCRVPSSIRRKPHPNEFYYPPQGANVFVRDKDGFFYRGSICGRRSVPFPGCWKYVVQLTDTFQVKDFEQQEVYPTYGECNASCESAHMVSLHHLLPRIPPVCYGKSDKVRNTDPFKDFENSVTEWDKSVIQMTDLSPPLELFFVQSKVISSSIYGELSFSQSLGRCSVAEYLTSQNLAVRVTRWFYEVIDALMNSHLIDHSNLLPTFNNLDDIRTSATKPTSPCCPEQQPEREDESNSSDFDFTGFKVHEADSALHRRLWTWSSINIIFKHAPLDNETIIRYVTPGGEIVLGTVLNVDLKISEKKDYSLEELLPRRPIHSDLVCDQYTEFHTHASFFDRLPLEPETSVESRTCLFDYDFEASRRYFSTRGGIFKGPNLNYAYSPGVVDLVRKYFESLEVPSLYEWQKLCFPSLFCKGNLLVIGSQPMAKLTTSTISALSWMTISEVRSDSKSISPILIVIVSDFNRANKVACLCKQLTDFEVIISMPLHKCRELEAPNGCDVLITTPSNWTELISHNIFDLKRLSHVIFDEFTKLNEDYSTDTAYVFDGMVSSRKVQIAMNSSCFSEAISDYATKLESITICVSDALLANLFHGLRPTVLFVNGNDWVNHLENIINEKRVCKRLLLCKNELEGKSILRQSCRERMLFVHENLSTKTLLRIVNEWRVKPAKLLVCTDGCFQLLDVKDVNVLISWMSSSMANLSSRFIAFSALPEMRRSHASAYIFCDSEKLDELLIVKSISENVKFVNGSLNEHLVTAVSKVERGKLGPICPFIFMFGKCSDVPTCSKRHLFNLDDDPVSFTSSQFLKVSILKAHSAFRYSARVHETISNTLGCTSKTLSSLLSNLGKIEVGLEKSSKDPPPKLEIGRMVGAKIEPGQEGYYILRRATVKCLPGDGSNLYTLCIIDYEEPDVRLPPSSLFILSEEIAQLPMDVVDLYITGIIPSDLKSDWQYDACRLLTNEMSIFLRERQLLAGKVELISNRSVLVDSLHCFKREQGQYVLKADHRTYSSFKDLILQSNFCVENNNHLSLLSSLLIESGLSPLTNNDGRVGCRTVLPVNPVPAVVSFFQDPGLFYVQLLEESERLDCLQKLISSSLDRSKQKLFLVALHELCVARNNDGEWNRAIVKGIISEPGNSCISVQVVFVDYGDVRLVCLDELYIMDDYGEVPFFAIESELVGIRPALDQWEERVTLYFESLVRNEDNVMKELLVSFCGSKNDGVHRSSYFLRQRVVLNYLSCLEEEVSINLDMVRKGLAVFDPDTKRLLPPLSPSAKMKMKIRLHLDKTSSSP